MPIPTEPLTEGDKLPDTTIDCLTIYTFDYVLDRISWPRLHIHSQPTLAIAIPTTRHHNGWFQHRNP